jgi:hypothetical protein
VTTAPALDDVHRLDDPIHLDDEADREELRGRYYGLMQELRVILPGSQVLVAFLLTAPFAQRFSELDGTGRDLYGVALLASILSVVAFMTPAALHRVGDRTDRSDRLRLSILLTRVGLALLGVGLASSFFVVTRFVFSDSTAVLLTGVTVVAMLGLWLALPLASRFDLEGDGAPDAETTRSS